MSARSSPKGYGKPPPEHQFRPGKSGNPKGRPKGAKNEATILHDLLHRKVEIRDGGRKRKITVLEAILLRFTEDALKGNTKSAAFVLSRLAANQSGESAPGGDLSEEDHEVLEAFARRFTAQHKDKKEEP
jgi:hypothetical protein